MNASPRGAKRGTLAWRPWSGLALAAALAAALAGEPAGAQAPESSEPRQPANPAAATPPAVAAPAPDRITFELKVPADRGGGQVAGSAATLEASEENQLVVSGGVEIKYKDLSIRADRLVFHRDSMTVEAELIRSSSGSTLSSASASRSSVGSVESVESVGSAAASPSAASSRSSLTRAARTRARESAAPSPRAATSSLRERR